MVRAMLAIAGAAALLGGCVSKTPFQCQQDEQCVSSGVAGRCELEGFCSFPDAECEEGFRFGESAGDLSGECVSADPVTTVCLAAQQLTIGSAHTCLLDVGGVVYCWGANFEGELGDGTTISRSSPARVAGLPGTMTQVAAGDDATCALDADGFVWCWGENDYGKLGTGGPATSDGEPEYRASPAVVLGLTGAIAITVGDEHMCAVLADGTAKCWGSNSSGRLGRPGSSTSTPLNVVVDDERTPLSGVTAIAAGLEHTCVIVDGGVKCWGLGDEGQLGDGQLTTSNLPVDVVGLAGTAVALTAGNNHTCALTDSGQAFCWGANADGQIGDGTVGDPSAVATLVGAGLAVASIEAGHAHTCARGDDSTVYCWGDNSRGQLGNGDTEGQDVTAPIPVLDDSQLVAAGGRHSCAIDASGSMQCWGYGLRGQLGDGVLMSSEDPVPVSGSAATAEQIALGDVFGCALSSGAVNCWGDDGSSQLGDSSSGTSRAVPGPVLSSGDPLTGVTDLFAGGTQGCGLLADGSASCWGAIAYGPEGSSAFTYPTAPTPIVAMELHRARSFALTSVIDQELYCAGYNGDGECMIAGSTTSTVGSVTQGDLGIGATAVTAGLDHTCVLIADVVQCVGQNDYGQLGDDVSAPTAGGAPIAVTLPATPVQLAAGDEHNCARLSTGEVYCWGRNSYGQLGDGTTQSTSTTGAPVKVTLPTDDAKAVVAQRQKSCAILGDDTIWCWGDNEDDLFRNPAVEDITRTPVQVLDTAVTQVDVGNDHMCAIYLADSSVHCWGRNDRGQLGDGRATNTLSPSPTVLTCEDE